MKKLLLGILLILFFNGHAQQNKINSETNSAIDSLLLVLNNVKEDTIKIQILMELGDDYFFFGNYEKALEYNQLAIDIAKSNGNKKFISTSLRRRGNLYFNQSIYEKAVEYYLTALEVAEESNNKMNIAHSLNNLGNVYTNMAAVSNSNFNYERALKFHLRALDIREKSNDTHSITNSLLNISNVYQGLGEQEKAIEYLVRALKEYTKEGSAHGIDLARSNLAEIYLNKGEKENNTQYYIKAEEYLSGVLSRGEESSLRATALIAMGRIYFNQHHLNEAIKYFTEGIEIAKTKKMLDVLENGCLLLAEALSIKGDYELAYKYHKLYSDIKDTLLNEQSSKQIAEMNVKYESEKKEKDIQLLTKDKNLQQAEISKQKLVRNGIIAGLAVALIFAFVLFNRFQVTNNQKKVIEVQNVQIVESINYSKKIQDVLLPSIDVMQQSLPNLFIYNSPKDIVSGDFYFFKDYENYVLLACVDCTGHGVPGGFMSTLGSLLLDKITDNEMSNPAEILKKLSDEVIRVLHQQSGGEIQDGMDLSVCIIDKLNKTVEFSGARNGIIVISNGEAKRYKANPLPVGGNYMKKGVPLVRNFETTQFVVNSTDWIYMYTDGFMEQVGGAESIPMNYAQFENELIKLSAQKTVENKISMLQTNLNNWSGIHERADDILILGFQLA